MLQNNEEIYLDNSATFNGINHKLYLVICVDQLSTKEYDAYIYSRHGGCHKKWCYQEKKMVTPTSIQFKPIIIIQF